MFQILAVVDVPSKYGLPYEDLEFKTSDNVLIKAYLMLQNHTDHRHGMSEEEVRPHSLAPHLTGTSDLEPAPPLAHSTLPAGRR